MSGTVLRIGYIICERRKTRKRLEKGVAATDTNDRWGGKKEKKNTGENLKQSWQNSMTPALILCIYIKNKK